MGTAIPLRTDYSASELRLLAKRADDAGQARRLLSLAAVLDGMSREEAAEIGAMDRQTLRDWVHRFNANGAAGLINGKAPGPRPKLSPEQKQGLKRIVETPPDPIKDGVVRWRCVDLRYTSKNASTLISTKCRLAAYSRSSALLTSAPGRSTPNRTRKPLRILKKLSRTGGGGSRR